MQGLTPATQHIVANRITIKKALEDDSTQEYLIRNIHETINRCSTNPLPSVWSTVCLVHIWLALLAPVSNFLLRMHAIDAKKLSLSCCLPITHPQSPGSSSTRTAIRASGSPCNPAVPWRSLRSLYLATHYWRVAP